MANFCSKCGAQVDTAGSFCRRCGAPLQEAISQASPNKTQEFINRRKQQMAQGNPAAGGFPYMADNRQAKPAKRRRTGVRVTAVLVILALVAGVLVTGFYKPGFFIRDGGPVEESWTAGPPEDPPQTQVSEEVTDALSHNAQESTDWENLDYSGLAEETGFVSTDPAECGLQFDAAAIQAATELKAAVSPSHPVAELGDVRIDFKNWNLDEENDEVSVRSLGEISEGADGWSIIGYDFSLASGQDSFDTNVEITIPRTATADEVGTCVTFNEETQQWEELYSTVSDDGKSYIIHTNHFSIKGEKKLKYVYSGGTLHVNKKDETVEIDNGLFHERYDPKKGTRMQSYVFADRQLLWAMYMAKDGETISGLMESIQALKEPDINALMHSAADERDAACLFIGTAGGMDNLNTLMGSIGYKAPFLGTYLTAADVALNLMNVQAQALESDKPYWEALSDAVYKNQNALGNSIFSAVMTLTTAAVYGNWVGALVGTVIWGGTYIIDKALEPDPWDVTDTPEWEDLYKVFYLTSGAKVTCGSKKAQDAISAGKYTYASMKKPKSFTDEQWAAVAKVVNKKPLRVEEVYDDELGGFRYDFINFAPAFTKIIELFYDKPYEMEKAIEDFYTAYANAMWNLPDKCLYNFAEYQCGLGAGSAYFKEEFTVAGDLFRPDKDDIKTWRDDMVSLVRARTAEQLEEAAENALHNTFSQISQNMNRLEKLLNTKLVFHVEDETLLPGQTFKDSIYCVDWQKIPENEVYLPKNNKDHSGGYDDPELVTPMRFVCGDPLFKPMEGVKGDDGSIVNVTIPYTEYYPYVPDFLPRAKKGQKDDVVYTCTLYHYLMMGSPQQMVFKDCSDPKHYMDQEGVTVDIEFPEIREDSVSVDVKIRISDGNDIGVLEGMWSPAPNGTKYEKTVFGSINLLVQDKGKRNTFLSEIETQKACAYHEDPDSGDSRFVYTRNAKKQGEKQTGVLTIWRPHGDPEDKLAFTVEEVEKNIIYLKEWNIYLMRYDPGAGKYSLKVDKDNLVAKVNIPDASIKVQDDGTIIIDVPGLKNLSHVDKSENSTTTTTYTRSGFTIEAKKSMQPDIPYGYDDAIGKHYSVTKVTDPIESTTTREYKSKKEDEVTKTVDKYKKHDFKIARGEEEADICSYVVLFYDCKNPDKLRFVQVYLIGLSDNTYSRNGKNERGTENKHSEYYLQLIVK